MNTPFAEALRKLRTKKGLTQIQLANLMFVNKTTISKWESGSRLPDAAMIARLARVLEVDVGTLFSTALSLAGWLFSGRGIVIGIILGYLLVRYLRNRETLGAK